MRCLYRSLVFRFEELQYGQRKGASNKTTQPNRRGDINKIKSAGISGPLIFGVFNEQTL